MIRFFLLRWT